MRSPLVRRSSAAALGVAVSAFCTAPAGAYSSFGTRQYSGKAEFESDVLITPPKVATESIDPDEAILARAESQTTSPNLPNGNSLIQAGILRTGTNVTFGTNCKSAVGYYKRYTEIITNETTERAGTEKCGLYQGVNSVGEYKVYNDPSAGAGMPDGEWVAVAGAQELPDSLAGDLNYAALHAAAGDEIAQGMHTTYSNCPAERSKTNDNYANWDVFGAPEQMHRFRVQSNNIVVNPTSSLWTIPPTPWNGDSITITHQPTTACGTQS